MKKTNYINEDFDIRREIEIFTWEDEDLIEDIYGDDEVEILLEDDEISDEEAGFMHGYNET